MIRFLRSLFGWAALLSAPEYPTFDPTTPPGFNPRATVYPHPDATAALLSGAANTEAPPPIRAGMPECCEAVWREGGQ